MNNMNQEYHRRRTSQTHVVATSNNPSILQQRFINTNSPHAIQNIAQNRQTSQVSARKLINQQNADLDKSLRRQPSNQQNNPNQNSALSFRALAQQISNQSGTPTMEQPPTFNTVVKVANGSTGQLASGGMMFRTNTPGKVRAPPIIVRQQPPLVEQGLIRTESYTPKALREQICTRPINIQKQDNKQNDKSTGKLSRIRKKSKDIVLALPREPSRQKQREVKKDIPRVVEPVRVQAKKPKLDDFECEQELIMEATVDTGEDSQINTRWDADEDFGYPPAPMQNNYNRNSPRPNLQTSSKASKSPKPRTIELQLQDFEARQQWYNSQQAIKSLNHMVLRQMAFVLDPQQIREQQKGVSFERRATLTNWMMEVCTQFLQKRDTFHLAVTLMDHYFSKTKDIPVNQLQLVGAVSLFVAGKIEEKQPRSVEDFCAATSHIYSVQMLLNAQRTFVKALNWKLSPPLLSSWANRIMQQWDLYQQSNGFAKRHFLLRNHPPLFFKKAQQDSFKNFSQVMQLIDCCVLDIEYLHYRHRTIVLAVLYLFLGKYFEEFKQKSIVTEFPRSSLFIMDKSKKINQLYGHFVEYSFGMMLFDLFPAIQFCAPFFALPMELTVPKIKDDMPLNMQDYQTYQLHNSNFERVVRRRQRGIGQ